MRVKRDTKMIFTTWKQGVIVEAEKLTSSEIIGSSSSKKIKKLMTSNVLQAKENLILTTKPIDLDTVNSKGQLTGLCQTYLQ